MGKPKLPKNPDNRRTTVAVYLDNYIISKLEDIARRSDRSFSYMIRMIAEEWLKEHGEL